MDKGDVVHVYSGILLSHKKRMKSCHLQQHGWSEIIKLSEVSQKMKDNYHMISLIHGIKNMTQMNLSMKQKQTHRHKEETGGCQG